MAREEQFYSGDGSGGDGGVRLSKKVKQKKVPQRGLGVAQLEKIRLEEQQKMDSLEALNVLGQNLIDSSSDIAQFVPVVNCPKLRSGVGVPSVYNSAYRQAPLVPSVIRGENSVPLNGNGTSLGHGTWPRLWNGEYGVVGEKPGFDHRGFGCEGQVILPYEMGSVNPVLTHPVLCKRSSHQFQQSSSPLMVNTSPGISRSPVVLRSQMEPPSNQSSRGDNYTPSWSDDDKIVGTKRPYPFTLESHRSDELASSSNGHIAQMEPKSKCIRENPSTPDALPKWNPIEVTRDNGKLSGDFLTLAPPSFASPPLDSKHNHLLEYSGNQGHKLSEFESMLNQESLKRQIYQLGPNGTTEQSFSFFPIKHQTNQTTSCSSNGDDEKGETLDLTLKL